MQVIINAGLKAWRLTPGIKQQAQFSVEAIDAQGVAAQRISSANLTLIKCDI